MNYFSPVTVFLKHGQLDLSKTSAVFLTTRLRYFLKLFRSPEDNDEDHDDDNDDNDDDDGERNDG